MCEYGAQIADARLDRVLGFVGGRLVAAAATELIVEQHGTWRGAGGLGQPLEIKEVVGRYLWAAVEHHQSRCRRLGYGTHQLVPDAAARALHWYAPHLDSLRTSRFDCNEEHAQHQVQRATSSSSPDLRHFVSASRFLSHERADASQRPLVATSHWASDRCSVRHAQATSVARALAAAAASCAHA
eukprot:3563470-Prymnesium_polylepis.1